MKTIGLIGGMSWESTCHYYTALNRGVSAQLGGLHSAKIILESLDFGPIEKMLQSGDWDEITNLLASAAQRIEMSGADCLLICTNTMHKVANQIQNVIDIPLLHIADAAGEHLRKDGVQTVGLLGTRFTMEEPFYKDRLEKNFSLKVLVPEKNERQTIDSVIFKELCRGIVKDQSRNNYLSIMESLGRNGCQAILEGCTEISMLVDETHTSIPLLDTTTLHVKKALDFALS